MPAGAITLALVLVAVLGGCRGLGPADPPAPAAAANLPEGLDTTVERIVDGDTLVVARGHTIRLIGVDTPETKDPRRPVQCFGEEAATFLQSMLPPGSGVRLVGDAEPTDTFGRTLAYVYRLPDGLFVNAALLRDGFAQPLTIPPNVAFADEFVALAREAREARRGLWGACEPG